MQEARSGETGEDAAREREPGGAESGAPPRPADAAEQAGAAGQPSEEQLRAAYEAELSRISSAEMVLQATVSLLNVGARRLGLLGGADAAAAQASPERDLEQVRDAIDAVRGLMPVVERRAPQEARPLRDALSQLQMAYARESQAAAPASRPGEPTPPGGGAPTVGGSGDGRERPSAGQPAAGKPDGTPAQGPAESSGRLWVPGR
jgi:hypothetical protein